MAKKIHTTHGSKALRYVVPLRGIRFVYGLMMFEAQHPLTRDGREKAVQYVIDNSDLPP